jgi:hypothetical protein
MLTISDVLAILLVAFLAMAYDLIWNGGKHGSR